MILPFHSLEATEESDTWWGSLVWILMLAALITISDDLFSLLLPLSYVDLLTTPLHVSLP